MVSGPVRHDHARDKKLTKREEDEETPLTDSQLTGGRSTAVLGTVVGGRYYVRKLCGEGGMGRVYEAEHIDIGKRVALKILHPAYSQTPDLVERLRREARVGVEDRAPERRRRDRLGDDARRRVLLRDGVPRGDRAG